MAILLRYCPTTSFGGKLKKDNNYKCQAARHCISHHGPKAQATHGMPHKLLKAVTPLLLPSPAYLDITARLAHRLKRIHP